MADMKIGEKFIKSAAVLFVLVIGLLIWEAACEASAHVPPDTKQISVESILEKEEWSWQDYETLSEQTGLAHSVLDALDEQGRRKELRTLQMEYFREIHIRCEPNSIISKEEYVVDEEGNPMRGMSIPYVEDGDILITFCSHCFGWRNGHAALVADAEEGLVLEAQVLGTPSVVTSLKRWERYPSFLILRLKDGDKGKRAEIAAYAMENLCGIPYRLTAGILEPKGVDEATSQDRITGTQCAHLIWYAFHVFGYDLDSDGGLVVTPRDIAESEHLSVVQKYGM